MFHTRQLSYPVLVTVYHMLECHGLDVLPYTADMVDHISEDTPRTPAKKPLHVRNPEDWCIFSIEVRNTYGIPFEVIFDAGEDGKSHNDLLSHVLSIADSSKVSSVTLVPPGCTTR